MLDAGSPLQLTCFLGCSPDIPHSSCDERAGLAAVDVRAARTAWSPSTHDVQRIARTAWLHCPLVVPVTRRQSTACHTTMPSPLSRQQATRPNTRPDPPSPCAINRALTQRCAIVPACRELGPLPTSRASPDRDASLRRLSSCGDSRPSCRKPSRSRWPCCSCASCAGYSRSSASAPRNGTSSSRSGASKTRSRSEAPTQGAPALLPAPTPAPTPAQHPALVTPGR